MADRGFAGLDQWRAASAGGADLLWRIKANAVLPVRQELPDGSYLSDIVAARDHRKRTDPTVVRVIEYTLEDSGRPQHPAPYRLITTILDHQASPATELAVLYNERWEIGTTLDELKTHQRGPAQVLRSRSPEGVEQEVWATYWSTTRSASSCTPPHATSTPTPTGSPSPAPSASCAAR